MNVVVPAAGSTDLGRNKRAVRQRRRFDMMRRH